MRDPSRPTFPRLPTCLRRRVRGAAPALLLAAALGGAGCDPFDQQGIRVRQARIRSLQYVELKGLRDDGRVSMDTCICFYPDGSFEFDLEAGDFRDLGSGVLGSTIGGIELRDAALSAFSGLSFRRIESGGQDGIQAYAYSHLAPGQPVGNVFFPGAASTHIRVARDAFGLLSYHVRPTEQSPWTPVGSIDFASVGKPLSLSYGAFGMPKGATIGFTGLRIDRIGTLPPDPLPEDRLEFANYALLGDLYDDFNDLEEFLYDNADLVDDDLLDEMLDELADLDEILDIIELVEAAAPTKRATREQKMRKGIQKEIRLLTKARKAVEAGKHKKALKPLLDAMKTHTQVIRTQRSGG